LTSAEDRLRVVVVSLGGTIASTDAATSSGVVPQLSALDLVGAIPHLKDVAEVDAKSFRQVPSGDLTLGDIIELSEAIKDYVDQGFDGVVVTQGTDTIEETAFALDVLLEVSVPVVVTGAMRNPTLASPDGPGNVLAAVRVAVCAAAHGLGCLVVMNDEVHAARFVRKTHTTSLATFRSPGAGALGWVAEDRVRIVSRPAPLATVSAVSSRDVVPVAVVGCALGEDGLVLDSLVDAGYRGVVIEALGGGHVPSTMVARLEALAERLPVVLCSRTGSGEVLTHTYGFAGSESDVLARGVLWGGALDARKARVALALSLAASVHPAHAVELFTHVRDSVSY
jgi:L-asparaginase